MKFRTECEVRGSDLRLSPDLPVVMAGSCFADNISGRMRRCLWPASNPLGVLFNPLSIARVLELCLLDADPSEEFGRSAFEADGLWHSWLFDSRCTAADKASLLANMERCRQSLLENIEAGKTLFVTFGTAYCYFLADSPGYVVANCHKRPQQMFERRRISVNEITKAWSELGARLAEKFEGLRIVLTVSPVRHLRDGLHENNLSKGTLLLAADSLCMSGGTFSYFPAYELVNDDLRDYRYYADDLTHPSAQAVEYIWEKFLDAYIDRDGREALREGEAIARRTAHRPLVAAAGTDTAFSEETQRIFNDFKRRHPRALDPDSI